MENIQKVFKMSEEVLDRALANNYINVSLKVFLGLYAAFAAPKLPPSMADLMDNVFVRISFAFAIIFLATKDAGLALMLSITFIITLQTANKFRLYNTTLSQAAKGEVSWLPSVSGNEENDSQNDATEEATGVETDSIEQYEGVQPSIIDNAETVANEEEASNEEVDTDANNGVPGADQSSCQKSFENQHCIQGLENSTPSGYSGAEHSDF